MIQTIKLPYTTSNENLEFLNNLRRQCSIIYRWSFNRFQESLNEKDIRTLSKNLKNIDLLDSWFIQSSIKEAQFLYASKKDQKVIFANKSFKNRISNKISNEQFKKDKLNFITSIGESPKKGNRKFNLDIIENNKIIFKPNRKTKIQLNLPKLRSNYKKLLYKLQTFSEQNQIPYMIKLDDRFIYISFDFGVEIHKKTEGNYIGLDLNPNFIGFSIFDKNQKPIQNGCFNLTNLTQKSNQSSSDKKSKYLENKLNFETIEISKKIVQLCQKFNIDFFFIEDLNFGNIKQNNKYFNRLCKNKWKRNLFVNNLKKRLESVGIKWFEVNPSYSSFIGNLTFRLPDAISAAAEIARRGYNVIIKKNKKFYPDFDLKHLDISQWKDLCLDGVESWKELFNLIKNSKLKYRVSFSEEDVFKSFRTFKSNVTYVTNCI